MYSTGKFAKLINRHVRTLQNWDNLGLLKPDTYTPKGRKQYSHEQYLNFINKPISNTPKENIIYARVSSFNQKNDLKQQINYIENYCTNNQIHIDKLYTDIGSGLNYNRKNFINLVHKITSNEVNNLIIAHKDRLTRFGFELIQELAKKYNTNIIIIDKIETTPQEEMVNDLMSIIHVFSSRLYGLRKYKNKIKELVESNEDSKEN